MENASQLVMMNPQLAFSLENERVDFSTQVNLLHMFYKFFLRNKDSGCQNKTDKKSKLQKSKQGINMTYIEIFYVSM